MFLPYLDLTVTERTTYSLYKTNSPFGTSAAFAYDLTDLFLEGYQPDGLWLQQVEILDGMLSRSSLPAHQVLYRATSNESVTRYLNGTQLVYPAYMPTSTDSVSVQMHFGGLRTPALLVIECTQGTPALDMDMNPQHGNTLEKEILLPRSLSLNLIDITTITTRAEMAQHMGSFYASMYSSLKIYKFTT